MAHTLSFLASSAITISTLTQAGVEIPAFAPVTSGLSLTPTITRSNLEVAPEMVHFGADLSGFDAQPPAADGDYDEQLHNIIVTTTFGDPGSTFDKLENVLPHQRDANTMSGLPVAHTYAQPGTYTVTMTAFEPSSGKMATGTVDVTVGDPDVVFAGDRTIYVDPDGEFSNAPAGAYTRQFLGERNDNQAIDRIWSRAAGGPSRIILSSGKVHPFSGHSIRGSRDFAQIRISSEDPTNPAIIQKNATGSEGFQLVDFADGNTTDFVLHDVIYRDNWNELTETGTAGSAITHNPLPPSYILAHNVVFEGCDKSITTDNSDIDTKLIGMSDCTHKSWLNFAFFLRARGHAVFLGNLAARDPNALAGGRKYESAVWDHNIHGPFRHQSSKSLVLAQNDMMSNSGWFDNDWPYRTHQPCARLMQSGNYCGQVNVTENTMEGGFEIVAIGWQNGPGRNHAQNYLVDRNILIGSHMSQNLLTTRMGGGTIRNNLMIHVNPDERYDSTFHPTNAMSGDPDLSLQPVVTGNEGFNEDESWLAENADRPISVYNNTYVNLEDTYINRSLSDLNPAFSNLVVENNIHHEPNGDGSKVIAGLDNTPIITPRINGMRAMYELFPVTLAADVLDGESVSFDYAPGRVAADYGPRPGASEVSANESHEARIGGEAYGVTSGDFTVDFGATQITVTNTSGATWPAGPQRFAWHAEANPAPNLTQYATPTDSVATYAPLAGSPVIGAATGLTADRDFYGVDRPDPPSVGAFEPTA